MSPNEENFPIRQLDKCELRRGYEDHVTAIDRQQTA